jgi:hypothetical protein
MMHIDDSLRISRDINNLLEYVLCSKCKVVAGKDDRGAVI